MWFFAAVLVVWGTTATIGRWDVAVLPPVVAWGWWTVTLYACGTAATAERFRTLDAKLLGMFGYALVVIYYTTQSAAYLALLPSDAGRPDLWPTVFVVVNFLGPLVLVTVGCLGAGVQREGEG